MRIVRPHLLATLALAAAAAVGAAGCGGATGSRRAPATPAAATSGSVAVATPAAAARTAVTVVRSQYGRILADGRGQALYVFTREKGRASRCYGACAKAWPPVAARGRRVAERGARSALLGTTLRRGGTRQLTYAGRPVYLYVGDSPGRVLCHDVTEFGGVWRVIRPDGRVVR
jgi:predicted lipoprotein with Yx(FWY)xxD motif